MNVNKVASRAMLYIGKVRIISENIGLLEEFSLQNRLHEDARTLILDEFSTL